MLDEAWQRAKSRARDLCRFRGSGRLHDDHDDARSLYKKHLLARRKLGRAFLYSPAVSREQLETGIREDVIEGLLDGTEGIQPVLACIVDAVSERDRELLDELERLVQEKKRQLTTE